MHARKESLPLPRDEINPRSLVVLRRFSGVSLNSRSSLLQGASINVQAIASRPITSDTHSVIQQSPATPLDDMASIVATYEQRIFRFHLISIRDRDGAESLTQDTFVRAWAARDSFRGDCSISTWLMRIALNLVRDHTRTDRFRFWKRVSETAVDVSDVASHVPHRDSSLESRLIASEQMTLVWESVAP